MGIDSMRCASVVPMKYSRTNWYSRRIRCVTGESRVKMWFLITANRWIVTVAKRTLAIGPFILRETKRSEDGS